MKGDWRICCLDILAVALLLLVTVHQTTSQDDAILNEFVSCPEGSFKHKLGQSDSYFSHLLKGNRRNYPAIAWQVAIDGSNAHLNLRGIDSYNITKINKDPFLLLQACCETKGVRNVLFTVKVPGDDFVSNKVVKYKKSEYTQSCMVIPETGLMAKSVRFRFRTTKGRMSGDEKQNDFKVRGLFITGCIPDDEKVPDSV